MAGSTVNQVARNVYTVTFPATKEAALVSFGDVDVSTMNLGGTASRGEFVPWGVKDDQLVKMHKLASDSPTKWRLIKTRRDFIVGLGVYTHSGTELKGQPTRFEPTKFVDFETWRELVNFDLEFVSFVLQYTFCANVFVQLTLDTSKKLVAIEMIDAFKVRVRKLKPGERKKSAFLVNPNFGTKAYKKADTVVVPAFDPLDPAKYPTCILQLMDRMPGQDYYAFPEWWSTEEWSVVANMIPRFHKSGLVNGYNLKYHISIPDDYFDREGKNEEETKALKEKALREMGESLSGVDNADKVLYTFHSREMNGDKVGGVIITPLKNTMSDDAYTKLFETANVAQASGHGVLPSLAGIDTGSKLGGSGKELEAAANYQQGFLTYTDRLILLQILYIAKRINGWPAELQFDIRNISLYTYDVTPGGTQQNPTTDQKSDNKTQNEDAV